MQIADGIFLVDKEIQMIGKVFHFLPAIVGAQRDGFGTWRNRIRRITHCTTTGTSGQIAVFSGAVTCCILHAEVIGERIRYPNRCGIDFRLKEILVLHINRNIFYRTTAIGLDVGTQIRLVLCIQVVIVGNHFQLFSDIK